MVDPVKKITYYQSRPLVFYDFETVSDYYDIQFAQKGDYLIVEQLDENGVLKEVRYDTVMVLLGGRYIYYFEDEEENDEEDESPYEVPTDEDDVTWPFVTDAKAHTEEERGLMRFVKRDAAKKKRYYECWTKNEAYSEYFLLPKSNCATIIL